MRVIIDVVFNHTSPDSVLVREHPEFFHQDEHGVPFTTVPAWSDVIDLRHPDPALTQYLIDTLRRWVHLGVDGFRCDVASLVPLDFWVQARAELAEVKPGLLWLAESVHSRWVAERRDQGMPTSSDAELFGAFDVLYDYDVWSPWQSVVSGTAPLQRYVEALRLQDCWLPANAAKLRCVENHDQFRIMRFAPTRAQALAWTAFAAFNRGPFMLYAGQESAATRWPSLFEHEPVVWGGYELTPFVQALTALKHHPVQRTGAFRVTGVDGALQAVWGHPTRQDVNVFADGLFGVFDVFGPVEAGGDDAPRTVAVPLPDGDHEDLIGGPAVHVRNGRSAVPDGAFVVRFAGEVPAPHVPSDLLDVFLHVEVMGDD